MRHTFASHHRAKSDNAPLTARQLGHGGDTSTLFEHYAALVSRKDGKAYFAIAPEVRPVIKMVKSA